MACSFAMIFSKSAVLSGLIATVHSAVSPSNVNFGAVCCCVAASCAPADPGENAGSIINYGERYRYGERISTGFVESTVNQVISKRFCKKQQMQWSKRGAHLLLQTRVKTLNGELGSMFKRWYPDMQVGELAEAA